MEQVLGHQARLTSRPSFIDRSDALPDRRVLGSGFGRVDGWCGGELRLRESWVRENCTPSLSGGRRPARERSSAPPPTRHRGSRVTPGEGRGLSSRKTQDVVRNLEIGQPSNFEKCSEAADGVHAKAKAEAGYRFYTMYDKISRDDILAHAYAQ